MFPIRPTGLVLISSIPTVHSGLRLFRLFLFIYLRSIFSKIPGLRYNFLSKTPGPFQGLVLYLLLHMNLPCLLPPICLALHSFIHSSYDRHIFLHSSGSKCSGEDKPTIVMSRVVNFSINLDNVAPGTWVNESTWPRERIIKC